MVDAGWDVKFGKEGAIAVHRATGKIKRISRRGKQFEVEFDVSLYLRGSENARKSNYSEIAIFT